MVYVALLRGVNVGGSKTVEMRALKAAFEDAGVASVRTYINSGNAIFTAPDAEGREDRQALTRTLEQAIVDRFGFPVDVLVRSADEMAAIAGAIPDDWANDSRERCDVFFLWPDVDRASILDELRARPGIDDVRYAPGAAIHRVSRENAARSGLLKLIGSPLYKRVTIRNCNTARKLHELMQAAAVESPAG